MPVAAELQAMLESVAMALGPELCQQMTFVGGCTTGLLLTDALTKEQVRNTDDVDLIVDTMGYMAFTQLQDQLREKGFTDPEPSADAPICAMYLGDLRVDFMPIDETVLGFTNRWYRQTMESATTYDLNDNLPIKLVTPVYFLATKLEAYKGRGNNDPMASRDIEDILNVIDGRETLLNEVRSAPSEVQCYLSNALSQLLENRDFEYAVQSQASNDNDREQLIFERLEAMISECPDNEPYHKT